MSIPHTTKLLPFLNDPTDLSIYARNNLNLKRYLNLDTTESKEVYLQLLASGMEKELAMTILPIIFRQSKSDIEEEERLMKAKLGLKEVDKGKVMKKRIQEK